MQDSSMLIPDLNTPLADKRSGTAASYCVVLCHVPR